MVAYHGLFFCVLLMTSLFSQEQILVAHRAADFTMPENTLESLIRMEAKGARWFEIDCYLMKDGNIAVIHDKSLRRTTTGKGRITNMTAVELFDVFVIGGEGGERIPMLPNLMDYCFKKGLHLIIEVKDSNLKIVSKIDTLIKGYDCDLFLIYSFEENIVEAFIEKKPLYPVRWTMEKLSTKRLLKARAMNVSINLDGRYVTASCIEKIEALGLNAHVYTVNDKERAIELFDLGVKAMCTDTLFGGEADG
jgi:glycerophosphoryl diester phosphodiesterase